MHLLASVGVVMVSIGLVSVAVLLIGLVLLQKNRGAGLSGALGGVGGHSAFGTKTGDFLTWLTVGLVAVFLVLSVVGNFVFEPTKSPQAEAVTPVEAEPTAPAPLPSQTAAPTASPMSPGSVSPPTESAIPTPAPPPSQTAAPIAEPTPAAAPATQPAS